jgi:hypothetical protein
MPKKARKKPLITKNWLPMEYIKGVPNVLTSKVVLAGMNRTRILEGKPATKRRWCIFCGRPFMSIQALRAHLRYCEKRRVFMSTVDDGWRFEVGSRIFIVKTLRWNWLREAASLEAEFSERVLAGTLTDEEAAVRFNYFVLGHQATYPRADAALEDEPAGIPAVA